MKSEIRMGSLASNGLSPWHGTTITSIRRCNDFVVAGEGLDNGVLLAGVNQVEIP